MAGFRKRYMTISTSPRSPYRIQHYLRLLQEFEGKEWNKKTQTEYYTSMVNNQEGDFPIGDSKTPDFSARDKINRAPKAFGFVQLYPIIKITEAGNNFLNPYLATETLIRQVLKYQLPSPIMPETIENEGYFNIKPFLELLRLIRTVGDLSTSEFRAFGITMTNHNDFETVVSKIKEYRIVEAISGKPKKKFYVEYMTNYIEDIYKDKIKATDIKVRESKDTSIKKFIKINLNNITDYADAYLRFLIGTELVLVNKQRKIVISQDKLEDVDYILKNVSREAIAYTYDQYENLLFNPLLPTLLTDNTLILNKKIYNVNNSLDQFIKDKNTTTTDSNLIGKKDSSTLDLKIELQKKEALLKDLTLESYSKVLKKSNQPEIDDIIETFNGIKNKEYFDNPLFLEWNCWRAITMINNGHISGSFKTNTLGEPTGTAGGNTADIIGDYGNFNMICEVTMSGGKKQYEMENEPVMRHLGELRQKSGKNTFGLFIAPTINDSLITEFYYKHKISTRIYGGTVEFIPLTISEFVSFFERAVYRPTKLNEQDIANIHIKSKEFADSATDEIDWYEKIKAYILNV